MTDQVTLGFWLGSCIIYFTAVSILDQHGKKKTKKKNALPDAGIVKQ